MGKKLTNNWGLKLIAILFALILWFAVINIDDPVVSETFKNVPVQLVNTEVLTEAGLTYEILDGTAVVETVTVYGPRTLVESLKEKDIIAKADMNDITVANTVAVNISVDTRNSSKISNIRSSLECVKLNVEQSKSKQLIINANANGKLASGYIVGGIKLDQNRIRISGPESVVSQIQAARVSVDVTEANSDVATYGTVKLYDKDDKEVQSDLLVKSTEKVHIDVNVIPTKYVPVQYEITGNVADGYEIVEGHITCSIMTVLIGGEVADLRNVDNILLTGEELDVSNASATQEIVVNMKNYLPENIILGDKEYDGKVTVTIPIEEVVTEVVELYRENIKITNVPSGYQVNLVDVPDYTELEVSGPVSEVRKVMTNTLVGTIDMSDTLSQVGLTEWQDGVYQVDTSLDVSNEIEYTPIKITIEVKKNEQ